MVEAAAAAAGHVRHHAVEHLAMGLVLIEAVIEEGAEKAAALRDPERNAALDRALRQTKLGGAAVLDLRDRIPHGRGTDANDRWILRSIDHLVNLLRLETRRHPHALAIV